MKNEYIFKDDLVIMSMTRRNGDQFNVLIDLDDFERVSSHPYKWCINANGLGKNYVHAPNAGASRIKLHRFIVKASSDELVVDHINGNTLDNRKINLREVSTQENLQNRNGCNKNNKVGMKGIAYISESGKYRGSITIDGKRRYTKQHDTPEKARAELLKF